MKLAELKADARLALLKIVMKAQDAKDANTELQARLLLKQPPSRRK